MNFLIKNGADVHIATKDGIKLCDIAIEKGDPVKNYTFQFLFSCQNVIMTVSFINLFHLSIKIDTSLKSHEHLTSQNRLKFPKIKNFTIQTFDCRSVERHQIDEQWRTNVFIQTVIA